MTIMDKSFIFSAVRRQHLIQKVDRLRMKMTVSFK